LLEVEATREEMKELNEDLLKRCEASEIMRIELDKELRKLKKKMINIPQGGHGTFSVVFEEVRKYHGISLVSTHIENNLAKKIGATIMAEHGLDPSSRSVDEKSQAYAGENSMGQQMD
jgi:hypothetical protein